MNQEEALRFGLFVNLGFLLIGAVLSALHAWIAGWGARRARDALNSACGEQLLNSGFAANLCAGCAFAGAVPVAEWFQHAFAVIWLAGPLLLLSTEFMIQGRVRQLPGNFASLGLVTQLAAIPIGVYMCIRVYLGHI